ncbi:MAG: hypothetical protein ACXVPQ_12185 [Bacteroidia bacterium]
MDNLQALSDGEYENVSGLLGAQDGMELLGRLSKLPKERQAGVLKALLKRKHAPWGIGNSRHEMEQKLDQIPKEILNGLLNKRLQLGDTRFYVTKNVSTMTSIDVLIGTDPKAVGVGNLAQQKLDKDNWFLLYAIMMRYAEGPTLSTVDFSYIPAVIANGEFEMTAGNKELFGPMENSCWDTRNRNDVPVGYYKLESTKLIEPQVEIKMPVKFASTTNANSWIKVWFLGTSVVPY